MNNLTELEVEEKKIKVETYLIRLTCNQCNGGEYKPSGPKVNDLTPHVCLRCNREIQIEGDPYPRVSYRPVQPAGL